MILQFVQKIGILFLKMEGSFVTWRGRGTYFPFALNASGVIEDVSGLGYYVTTRYSSSPLVICLTTNKVCVYCLLVRCNADLIFEQCLLALCCDC